MGIDGEGIRTLVVLQGCPLRCRYCINPFTWDGTREPELLSAEELCEQIHKDLVYLLATKGGITFGGGEPLLYPQLINDVRRLCDSEATIYLETALHVPWENVAECMDSVDGYYVDIKTLDPDLYREYTGAELDTSLTNLKKLMEHKPVDTIVVRVPEIPGMVDPAKQEETCEALRRMGIRRIDTFQYIVE